MSDEMEQQQKRPWWLAVVTIPNVLAIGGLLIGGAMTYQAQLQRIAMNEDRTARAEARISALEERLDKTITYNEERYMRKDLFLSELGAIRVEIQGLRRDLR